MTAQEIPLLKSPNILKLVKCWKHLTELDPSTLQLITRCFLETQHAIHGPKAKPLLANPLTSRSSLASQKDPQLWEAPADEAEDPPNARRSGSQTVAIETTGTLRKEEP